jgi:hypothetical protein
MCAMACCCCSVKSNMRILSKEAKAPKFICKECGRVATRKQLLCHPKKL